MSVSLCKHLKQNKIGKIQLYLQQILFYSLLCQILITDLEIISPGLYNGRILKMIGRNIFAYINISDLMMMLNYSVKSEPVKAFVASVLMLAR